MERLFGREVFEVGDEMYRWEDVVAFGVLTGRLQGIEYRARQGLACEAYADALDTEDPAIDEAVDEAAAEFRYARDLVTAEEAEAWLASRKLSADDWLGVLRREVLRGAFAAQIDQILRDHGPSQVQILEAIRLEWLCADSGSALADGLAEWAAAASADAETAPEEEPAAEKNDDLDDLDFGDREDHGSETETARGTIGEAPGIDLSPYRARLGGLPEPAIAECVERLYRLRNGHARFCLAAASAQAVRKEVELHRLDWVRMDARALFFDGEAASREGALCIREDGMTFDQLAADAGSPVFDVRFLLTEVAEDVRPILLGARPREVIGPIWFDERWALLLVLDKILPTDQDEQLRHRAVESAVERAVATQVTHRVRWLLA